jgi:hypothetical protein
LSDGAARAPEVTLDRAPASSSGSSLGSHPPMVNPAPAASIFRSGARCQCSEVLQSAAPHQWRSMSQVIEWAGKEFDVAARKSIASVVGAAGIHTMSTRMFHRRVQRSSQVRDRACFCTSALMRCARACACAAPSEACRPSAAQRSDWRSSATEEDADFGMSAARAAHHVATGCELKARRSGAGPRLGNKKPRFWRGFRRSMVAKDGIEPPTRGFSIPCSTN